MKTFGYIAAVPILLGLCHFVGATTPCYVRPAVTYRAAAVHYQAPVHQAYNYAQYQAPLSIGYQPDQTEVVLKALEIIDRQGQREAAANQRETQLLKALIASGGTAPLALKEALQPTHPGALLMRNDCARCHSAEDKAAKGKGNIYFKGGEFIGTSDDLGAMHEAVEAGTMPRDRKFSDAEKFQWLSWVTRMPPSQAQQAQAKAGG